MSHLPRSRCKRPYQLYFFFESPGAKKRPTLGPEAEIKRTNMQRGRIESDCTRRSLLDFVFKKFILGIHSAEKNIITNLRPELGAVVTLQFHVAGGNIFGAPLDFVQVALPKLAARGNKRLKIFFFLINVLQTIGLKKITSCRSPILGNIFGNFRSGFHISRRR